ncbi:NUMOD4 domain-containing protein [Lacticaseibacillus paracasei]|uniref:NUMOD4 domain-containing protein n=1 Tax=Lacticaseibacillus paracasei TaxID=1597 RepID=UPI00124AE68E|nr:NUMOD4 domain-containing protein [Lacticaseibacillus paracasei]KAB1963541.1 endonuclease [Lacticaseibacillus paracasei]MCT3331714.1 endonuclease [Lacticaseibacillus paracasei]
MFKEEREIWKDIEGFEGLYQVSNMGRVRSVDRKDSQGHFWKGKVLIGWPSGSGYLQAALWRDGHGKNKLIHRLVAEAFISNPHSLPQVNHKDENKTNNRVDNLEYCSAHYNIVYGTRNERMAKAEGRPIYVISDSGHRYYFDRIAKATRLLGLDGRAVNRGLRGKRKYHHGFQFEWAV